MERIAELVKQRKSVRSFDGAPLREEDGRSLPVTDRGGVQKLDIGIALAHFVLALAEQGISGTVTAADPGLTHGEGVEYIVSWHKS